jgi:hypothetical protein
MTRHKPIEEYERTIKLLEKKCLLLETALETELAKAELDCKQKLTDQKNRLLVDLAHEKQIWHDQKAELNKVIKEDVRVVVKEPPKPRRTGEKIKAIIDVITET